MARNFLTPINLNGLELQGAAIGNLSTSSINAITSGTGRIQYDNTLNVLKYRDNSGWQTISTGGGSFTLGSTSISLGSTTTTVAGLSSVTSTTFVGALTGNASTATTAATWTTTRALAGNNVNGSVDVAFANKFIVQGTTDAGLSGAQFLGALGTGILKNTTTTGVLSIAVAGDFPTLNQNTTGSAGSVANTLTFGTGLTAGGASFNGSAPITITPVSASTSVAGIVQLSDSTSTTSSVLAATATAAKAAYDRGSTGVSDAATAQTTANAALPKTGGTMAGAIAMGSNKITGLGTPTAAADAATKDYVDNVSAGINIHEAVVAATTGTIAGVYAAGSTTANPPGDGGTGVGATITYSATGVVTLDTSVTLAQGDRVLVKDGVTAASGSSSIANGVYVVTTAGAVGTAAILTRATDSDNSIFGDLAAGDLVYVLGGSTHGGDQFVQTAKGTATQGTGSATVYSVKIGTDAISYTQFSGAGAVPLATDTVEGIAKFPTAQFTVTTGSVAITTVNPSVVNNASSGQISGARGGTGVDNGSKTITVSGNTTIGSSTHTVAFATGGNTTVTLPTSGTLLTTTGSGSSLTFGTGTLSLAGNVTHAGSFTQTFTATANTSLTLPTNGTVLATPIAATTATPLTVAAGAGSGVSSAGGALTLTGGAAGGTNSGGAVTINGGAGLSGGAVAINGGTGSTSGAITIGSATTASVGIGASGITTTVNGTVQLPNVQSGTAGFVKIAATTGQLSTASIAYADLPTSSLTAVTTDGIARKKTGTLTANSSTTAFAINHQFGQWVTAQVFDATGNLVEVDVLNASTSSGTTTFTFAVAPTTGTDYKYVIVG